MGEINWTHTLQAILSLKDSDFLKHTIQGVIIVYDKVFLPQLLQGHLYEPYLPARQLYVHQQSVDNNQTLSKISPNFRKTNTLFLICTVF